MNRSRTRSCDPLVVARDIAMNLFATFAAGLPLTRVPRQVRLRRRPRKWQRAAEQTPTHRRPAAAARRSSPARRTCSSSPGRGAATAPSQCPIFERFAEAAPVIVDPLPRPRRARRRAGRAADQRRQPRAGRGVLHRGRATRSPATASGRWPATASWSGNSPARRARPGS